MYIFGPLPMMLRALLSTLSSGSLLAGLGDPIECWELNQGQTYQASTFRPVLSLQPNQATSSTARMCAILRGHAEWDVGVRTQGPPHMRCCFPTFAQLCAPSYGAWGHRAQWSSPSSNSSAQTMLHAPGHQPNLKR